jgi:hypothetical protein
MVRAREYARAHLAENPCVDCGEADPNLLDFDHIDPSTKVLAVAELIRQGREADVRIEVAKCEIRCANCHRRRTAREFKWHKVRLMAR